LLYSRKNNEGVINAFKVKGKARDNNAYSA